MKQAGQGWQGVAARVRVGRLTLPLLVAVPALSVHAFPKSTRGFSFPPGKTGLASGGALVGGSLAAWALLGPAWGVVAFWLFGTLGAAYAWSAVKPVAFVKPICSRCRLLPVIVEHEAIHLAGVASEEVVWASMRARHSTESLGLEGDPSVCSFCPIPKRIREG
jgi:hypothetical protein